jgi:hypothetical protein
VYEKIHTAQVTCICCVRLWAPFWYEQVHSSEGFGLATTAAEPALPPPLSEEQLELYREALPFYELLARRAIGRESLNPGSSPSPSLSVSAAAGAATVLDHGELRRRRPLVLLLVSHDEP